MQSLFIWGLPEILLEGEGQSMNVIFSFYVIPKVHLSSEHLGNLYRQQRNSLDT